MTVYHALYLGKTYDTFAYDLFGTLKYLGFKDQIKFIKHCRLTEKSCDRLCKRLNNGKQ